MKPYCGIGRTPKNREEGTAEYCLRHGQVRRFGIKEIPEDIYKDYIKEYMQRQKINRSNARKKREDERKKLNASLVEVNEPIENVIDEELLRDEQLRNEKFSELSNKLTEVENALKLNEDKIQNPKKYKKGRQKAATVKKKAEMENTALRMEYDKILDEMNSIGYSKQNIGSGCDNYPYCMEY